LELGAWGLGAWSLGTSADRYQRANRGRRELARRKNGYKDVPERGGERRSLEETAEGGCLKGKAKE
jgi:hypothetical protein